MANYLKGTDTLAWIRAQSDDFVIVVSAQLDVGFAENAADPSGVKERDGTAHTNIANFDTITPYFENDYVIRNRNTTYAAASGADTVFPADPMTDVVTLDPSIEYERSEFDALGVTEMQSIPIRRKFTLSVTKKALSGFWLALCLGDAAGNYASHGVHDTGSSGTGSEGRLTCHEGRVGYPGYTDVGFCIQIYLGLMDTGRYLVLRADNCVLRSAGMAINAADLNEITLEFVAGSGYYYTLASEPTEGYDLTWT